MDLLSEEAITAELRTTASWERSGSSIVHAVTREDFRDAMLFVGAVAYLAEAANHHPDIDIRWNTVRLVLTTHDSGGVTLLDLALAGVVDRLRPDILIQWNRVTLTLSTHSAGGLTAADFALARRIAALS